jgi:hypothetical protein
MVLFLTQAPVWISSIILVGFGTALAILGPLVVRRYVTLEKLTVNNEVAGFKFATVGVLYAVLLAFSVIVVWQKFSDAADTVVKESGAAASLYQLSYGLSGVQGAAFRGALTSYIKSATSDEWPAMEQGRASKQTAEKLSAIYGDLLALKSFAQSNSALMSEVLRRLDALSQARRARLVAAEGSVPDIVWAVLLGGAVVTITFTFFFGTRNLRAQVLMTALLSILILSQLLIVVVIDRPFTGPVNVGPEPLAEVLVDFAPSVGG